MPKKRNDNKYITLDESYKKLELKLDDLSRALTAHRSACPHAETKSDHHEKRIKKLETVRNTKIKSICIY